jgi:hypothetical protein
MVVVLKKSFVLFFAFFFMASYANAENATLYEDLYLSKADPEVRLIDTGDINYGRLVRIDGKVELRNYVNKPATPGNALRFDGSTAEYVTIESGGNAPPSLQITGDMSISLWVDYDSGGGGATPYLIARDDNTNRNWVVWLDVGTGFVNFGIFKSGALNFITGDIDVRTGYHHIVVVNDEANTTLQIYVDNVLDESDATKGGTMDNDPEPIIIGQRGDFIANRSFKGDLDEIVIWDEVRDANDVSDLYDSGSGLYVNKDNTWPTDGGTIGGSAIWHFDQSSGASAPDSSANSNTGVLTGMEDADWVSGWITSIGSDVEISGITIEGSARSGVAGKVTIGQNVSNAPEMVYDGYDQTWKIVGVTVMDLDTNGTLTIDNGEATAQQIIVRAAPSASENIQEWQDSSSNILAYIDQDGILGTNSGRIKNTTRVTSSPYNMLATDHVVYVDTDGGAITVNLLAGVDGATHKIINCGSSGNDITLTPDGTELLNGVNASETIIDSEHFVLTYETTEGWW